MTYEVAQIAVATGISPLDLLELSPDMYLAVRAAIIEQNRRQSG
jgi:hypothetical protein